MEIKKAFETINLWDFTAYRTCQSMTIRDKINIHMMIMMMMMMMMIIIIIIIVPSIAGVIQRRCTMISKCK